MPSMETLVASVVRQVRTTWSPADMVEGVAVNCAVGAGMAGGGAVSAGGSGFCLCLQPAIATKAATQSTGTRERLNFFKMRISFCI